MRVLSVLAICFLYVINVGNAKRGFILTSPKVFDAARMGYFTLSVFDVPPGEEITIRLMAKYGVLVEKKVNIIPNQNMGLEMHVPPLRRNIRAELHIFGKFRDGYEINIKENVLIRLKSGYLTLIQTDKPQYKPGQTVRFRVLPLNDDLMPLGKDAKGQVWIEDSNGIRVSQWSNLTFETHMMQLELPISDEPGFGQWSIKSTINDINHQINFRVEKYVLPEFEVKINSPPYVLDTAETYSAEICARYTYGKKVDGFLRARVIAETNEKPYPKVKYAWKISGCHTMIINTEYLSFKNGLQFKSLKVLANVFQDGTDTVVNKTIAIPIVPKEKMFRLTFLNSDGNGDHYKPGIPYSTILQVLKFDDTVAAWVNVEICIDEAECSTVLSDRDGIISITLNTINHDKKVFSIKAKVVDTLNESNSSDQRASTTNFFIKSWYSPTHSYIQIKRIVEELECGKIQNITIYYTATEEDTVQFYYQVLSRGQIMQHGSHLQTFHSKDDMSKYKNSTALPKVEEFVLSLNVTVAMSPIARLLVFYVRENGEIVADSNIFRIQKCLMNKVGLNFIQKQQYPSTEATIHLSASPSICGIRMVDKSVQLLDENSHFNKDKLFKQLQHEDISLDSKPSELRIRLCRRMLDFDDWASRIEEDHYADSLSAFERAGTVVISDLIFETGGCDSFMIEDNNDRKNRRFPWGKRKQVSVEVVTTKPPELALEPTDEIRSLFPETWLWEMHLIESTGQKTLKRQLPHTLTEWVGEAVCINSKSGLGISEKSSITAFQPFFLSLQLPYSVIRGESVPIKVSVFNYLKECLPIKISLGSSKDYYLVSETPTFSLCACSGDSESRSFMVQPVSLGQVNITVYGSSFEADNTFCFNKMVSTLSAKDAVTKQLLVEADGFPMEDVFNYPICSGVTYGSYSSETALLLPENAVDGSARAYVSVS
ncbi:alpha-1-macroglobulin-like, partial [Stegodyphus dumicola]|uniref:alpha-1-macroglobulin-like n=1 Tax=Stegodyphus dumicola TaxID=202533 RepID=UPI0015ABC552